jgi:hypothetical protein
MTFVSHGLYPTEVKGMRLNCRLCGLEGLARIEAVTGFFTGAVKLLKMPF